MSDCTGLAEALLGLDGFRGVERSSRRQSARKVGPSRQDDRCLDPATTRRWRSGAAEGGVSGARTACQPGADQRTRLV